MDEERRAHFWLRRRPSCCARLGATRFGLNGSQNPEENRPSRLESMVVGTSDFSGAFMIAETGAPMQLHRLGTYSRLQQFLGADPSPLFNEIVKSFFGGLSEWNGGRWWDLGGSFPTGLFSAGGRSPPLFCKRKTCGFSSRALLSLFYVRKECEHGHRVWGSLRYRA